MYMNRVPLVPSFPILKVVQPACRPVDGKKDGPARKTVYLYLPVPNLVESRAINPAIVFIPNK